MMSDVKDILEVWSLCSDFEQLHQLIMGELSIHQYALKMEDHWKAVRLRAESELKALTPAREHTRSNVEERIQKATEKIKEIREYLATSKC